MGYRIGIDIDGCLSDSISTFIEWVYLKYGILIHKSQLSQFDIWEVTDITKEQAFSLFDNPNFINDINPKFFSVPFTEILYNGGWEIYIVTARPEESVGITTIEWLKRKQYKFNQLIFSKDKATIARDLYLDCFVEDKLSTAIELSPVCKEVYLMDDYWNRFEHDKSNIVRVQDWFSVLNRLGFGSELW